MIIALLISLFLLLGMPMMGQNPTIALPADGDWPTIVGDSIMLIGPRQNELTEEQRYFNPPYLLIYPGKEHLTAQMIRAGLCDCDPTQPNRRIGVFSVSGDKKVSFSQGNLQYLPAINLWKFANTQYEYLGNANKYLTPTFRNWVDLFGWSANNTTAPFGVSTSTNAADYAGNFVDWGTNEICGDAPNTWRTLSIEEWEYIYHGRENADQLLALATLEGVPGLILLPDNWQQPEDIPFVSSVEQGLAWDATRVEGSYFDATNKDHTKDNIYTQAQWQIMEALGAVFLPCAGWRQENTWHIEHTVEIKSKCTGSSWSCSTPQASGAYYLLRFTQQEIRKYSFNISSILLACGRSVRLVHDTIVPQTIPDPCLVVKVNDTLSINMMCVEGGTFMMGAMEGDEIAKDDEKPAHKVTLTYDYHIMQTEVTQELWEAVMGEDIYVAQTKMENAPKPAYAGGDYPMYYVRMNDALEFIDKLNAMTGMHFRLPTEAEWEYAARGGNKSKGYLYAGSNNADDVGWYYGRGGLHRVAQLKPNELGIYDMSGNVSEMCLDYGTYGETYKAGDVVNPRGNIRSNGNRFWRGGSYTHRKDSMRVSQRSSYTPSWGGTWMGLRLVLAEDNDFRTIRVGNSYFDMSFVKGGTFMMGSDAPDAEADEQPVHEVTLSDYYIGQTEVTQHLWKKVMGDENNPSATKGNNLPVTNITWDEAQVFVQKLSEMTGMRFRLPTEAEWEYAARGGQKSKGYTYAGSNNIDEVAWYPDNCTQPQAIGKKMPNELGIYDMTGNVYELCYDWYGPYSAEAQTNPLGPNSSSIGYRIVRGGCWQVQTHGKPDSHYCRIANRGHDINGNERIGLRIVLVPEKN